MKNKYQKRYLDHQKRKSEILKQIIDERYSERNFSDKKIEFSKIDSIIKDTNKIPSSCDRHAVNIRMIIDRDDKDILAGLLVGGVGWLHRAKVVLLIVADDDAYVENLEYMPYLDAGVMINQIYLTATSLRLGVCYVNPNVRVKNMQFFRERFDFEDNDIFCGAIALGYKNETT